VRVTIEATTDSNFLAIFDFRAALKLDPNREAAKKALKVLGVVQ
jgi:hypothetical protein